MGDFIAKLWGSAPVAEEASDFSTFFRKASSGEKKRVFIEVAKRASADQRKVLEQA